MSHTSEAEKFGPPGNVILLRGACMWLLVGLVLAWCLVGLAFQIPVFTAIFPGKFNRLVQGHIDFLLMTALIFGIYATRTALPWHVRWAMVIGAFTNSSLFVMMAMFPSLESQPPPQGLIYTLHFFYLIGSLSLTSYGFGRAVATILKSTFPDAKTTPASALGFRKLKRAAYGLVSSQGGSPARIWRGMSTRGQSSPADPLVQWLIFTGLTAFAALLLWFFGLAQQMLAADRTYISLLIIAIYVATSIHCFWRTLAVCREADAAARTARRVSAGRGDRLPNGHVAAHISELKTKAALQGGGRVDQTLLLRVLAERLRGSNDFGAFASDSLMKLGLFGTIVGFIIMLAPISGLDTENQAAVRTSMSLMSEGMAVAMYTTLTGLVGSLLVKVQYSFVEAATSRIFASAVELTEVHILPELERARSVAA